MDDLTRKLQRCLRQHLMLPPDEGIDMSVELRYLGLDSMSAVPMLLDLEQTFSISFPDSLISRGTFRTGATLLVAIRELVASQPPGQ